MVSQKLDSFLLRFKETVIFRVVRLFVRFQNLRNVLYFFGKKLNACIEVSFFGDCIYENLKKKFL